MAIKTPASLKSFFEQGDRPSEAEFVHLVDSTYSGEIGAAIVSAASAGSTGLLQIDSASAVSFVTTGSAGLAIVSAGTVSSVRSILEAGSAGEAVWLAGTQASARTAIDVTAATTAKAGLIEIATTAEVIAGTDSAKALTPATDAAIRELLQRQRSTTAASSTSTTVIPRDDTVPQNTEGDELLTVTITPKRADSTLHLRAEIHTGGSANTPSAALFRDSTAGAIGSGMTSAVPSSLIVITVEVSSVSTTATTFKLRVGPDTGTMTINGASGARLHGGTLISSLTVEEYAP